MSKLTFNGKMKSCALQVGKTNKPGANSPQPGVGRAPALPPLPSWEAAGVLSIPKTGRPTSGASVPLPGRLIGLTKPKRVLTYCLYFLKCDFSSHLNGF